MRFLKNLGISIFFGNYFYGICTVALSIEASLQQYYPLNNPAWYIFVFSASVVYYTYAYMGDVPASAHDTLNKRTQWYIKNRGAISVARTVFYIITACSAAFIIYKFGGNIFKIKFWQWLVIASVPAVALLYYGPPFESFKHYNLRQTGWLKPFIIGYVWAGSTTIYPLIFYQVETGYPYTITYIGLLLFIKNLMYISVLGIMFDIKDYAADHNRQLKTFVVRVGLRKTLFYIILPLAALGFLSFAVFAFFNHFGWVRILFNSVPFILLLWVGYSMHQRRSIMYYLVVIDGLMLLKAICGILGMEIIG
ncbi:MAG TPA: UbiA family prenyltransferase [Chitinophagaceae bacterium]|nr:UbiA family prenyltransferase [Chitinophagaceae bacterium]